MSDILVEISKGAYNWLLGFTKKIQEMYPGASYSYSQEHKAWQIFSAENELLISIGISMKTNEFIYRYWTASGMKDGRTRNIKDLLDIYPKIGGQ